MSLVASRPGGEACVCDLNDAFDLSQPTISHHLKMLHEAGLVDGTSAACGSTTGSGRRRCPAWAP
jgi:DNA-binding transcriptional ArsR family regulator